MSDAANAIYTAELMHESQADSRLSSESRPSSWWREVCLRVTALRPFASLRVNAVASVSLYPTQISSAMLLWCLVEAGQVGVVLMALLLVSALATLQARLPVTLPTPAMPALVALLAVGQGMQAWRFDRDGTNQTYDWNRSWNEFSHAAALWLHHSVPADAKAPINSCGVLPFLREPRRDRDIIQDGITCLSAMEEMVRPHEPLMLEKVHAKRSRAMRPHYRTYPVRGPLSAPMSDDRRTPPVA